MTNAEIEMKKMEIQVQIEEYKSCRNEIHMASKFLHQSHIFELIFFGAIVTFLLTAVPIEENVYINRYELYKNILLLAPIPFYFLILPYIANNYKIFLNASYVNHHLAPLIQQSLKNKSLLGWEEFLCDTINKPITSRITTLLLSEALSHFICPVSLFAFILYLKDGKLDGKYDCILVILNFILIISVAISKKYTIAWYKSICR